MGAPPFGFCLVHEYAYHMHIHIQGRNTIKYYHVSMILPPILVRRCNRTNIVPRLAPPSCCYYYYCYYTLPCCLIITVLRTYCTGQMDAGKRRALHRISHHIPSYPIISHHILSYPIISFASLLTSSICQLRIQLRFRHTGGIGSKRYKSTCLLVCNVSTTCIAWLWLVQPQVW